MSHRMLKFEVPVPDGMQPVKIEMPLGAKPLHVGFQFGSVMLWALCDTANTELKEQEFMVCPTGVEVDLPAFSRFVGSAVSPGGELVFHIFSLER